jgi:AcrR family transcriptional regulator
MGSAADNNGPRPQRADAQRNRAAIIEAAGELLHRDGANASLEEIARRAGVGSATLHRHFRGHRALLEAVFDDRVGQMCAEAERIAQQHPAGEALWIWLTHVARHCAQEKALAVLLRNVSGDNVVQNRSFGLLGRAGQDLLDRAAGAGTVARGVTVEDLLLLVNAVSDVCRDNGADIDRILELAWNGARRPSACRH